MKWKACANCIEKINELQAERDQWMANAQAAQERLCAGCSDAGECIELVKKALEAQGIQFIDPLPPGQPDLKAILEAAASEPSISRLVHISGHAATLDEHLAFSAGARREEKVDGSKEQDQDDSDRAPFCLFREKDRDNGIIKLLSQRQGTWGAPWPELPPAGSGRVALFGFRRSIDAAEGDGFSVVDVYLFHDGTLSIGSNNPLCFTCTDLDTFERSMAALDGSWYSQTLLVTPLALSSV